MLTDLPARACRSLAFMDAIALEKIIRERRGEGSCTPSWPTLGADTDICKATSACDVGKPEYLNQGLKVKRPTGRWIYIFLQFPINVH